MGERRISKLIPAKEELLAFLEKGDSGISEWNAWKDQKQTDLGSGYDVTFDLTGIDLNGQTIPDINLAGCLLSNAILNNAVLDNAVFWGSVLRDADCEKASLVGAELQGASLVNINAKEAQLDGAVFFESNLRNANLKKAWLNGTRLSQCDLRGATLSEAQLKGAVLNTANLKSADLEEAILTEARLEKVIFEGANLKKAVLDGAILNESVLRYANLEEAALKKADLEGADLEEANLKKANLEEARLFNAVFNNADLTSANLAGIDARVAVLERASCRKAIFTNADFRNAKLSDADLEEAIFRNAVLEYADLQGANLKTADLSGARVNDANLSSAVLDKANLTGAQFEKARLVGVSLDAPILERTSFREANLEKASFKNVQLRRTILDRAYFKDADFSEAKGLNEKWVLVHDIVTNSEADRLLSKEDLRNANLSYANLHGADLRKANLKGAILDGANLLGVQFSRLDMRGQKGGAQFYMEVFPTELQAIDDRRAHLHTQAAAQKARQGQAVDTDSSEMGQPSLGEQYTEILYPSPEKRRQAPEEEYKIVYGDMVKLNLFGLALSGGGIRSATFSLGVIQVLRRYGLFKHVDYLSTVSGGGYIGSCLTTAMSDNRSENPFQYEKGEQEPQVVHHLRNSSKYLTANSYTDSLKPYAMFARGILSNLMVVLLFVLPFVILIEGVGHLFFGAIESLEDIPKLFTWLKPLLVFLTVTTLTTLIIVLPFVLSWIQRSYYIKESSVRSFHWWARRISLGRIIGFFLLMTGLFLLSLPGLNTNGTSIWGQLSEASSSAWNWMKANTNLLLVILGGVSGVAGLIYLARFASRVRGTIRKITSWIGENLFSSGARMESMESAPSTQAMSHNEAGAQPASEHKPDASSKKEPIDYSLIIEGITAWSFFIGFFCLGLLMLTYNWQRLGEWFSDSNALFVLTALSYILSLSLALTLIIKRTRKVGLRVINFLLGPFILFVLFSLPPFWLWSSFIHGLEINPLNVFDLFEISSTAFQWIGRGVALISSVLLFVSLKWFYNPNLSSMHRFFRDRLSKAYLVRVNEEESKPDHVDDLKLSKLNGKGSSAPYHLINVALNLPGSKADDLRGRNADFFFFGSRYTGGPRTGYCKTSLLEKQDPHINLGTAMAISAAAAAPNMGTYTMRGVRSVLTLLNIRLGYWMTNPDRILDQSKLTETDNRVRRTLEQVSLGPLNLLNEFRGKLDEEGPSVNLSDGGHIENMGIYELLRRRCKYIISVEGASDPQGKFSSLLQLIRYARIDMGIEIKIDLDEIIRGKKAWTLGSIRYGPQKEHWGYLLYIKLTVTDELEHNYIRSYKKDHPGFPYESIADQSFDEAQFEVYRELGYQNAKTFFSAFDPDQDDFEILSDQFNELFEGNWIKKAPKSEQTHWLGRTSLFDTSGSEEGATDPEAK